MMINVMNIQEAVKNISVSLPVITSRGKVRLATSAPEAGKLWKTKYMNIHDLPGISFST
ncbi:MAG: hypothetical protein ACQEQD_06355 [Bacillota bacterium]